MTYKRYTVSCLICRTEISSNNLYNHYNSKRCIIYDTLINNKSVYYTDNCRFCHKLVHSKAGLSRHESACKENPNRVAQFNQHSKAKSMGKVVIISDLTREKIRIAGIGRKHSEQQIKNISDAMKKAVINSPESFRGTYNRGNVKKVICSNGFVVLGSWEKLFVEFCIMNNIRIEQPEIPFSYEFNGNRLYFPDFYLPDIDTYIEIKGMQTDRDLAKWYSIINLHKKNLSVLKKTAIKMIQNNKFYINSIADFQYKVS